MIVRQKVCGRAMIYKYNPITKMLEPARTKDTQVNDEENKVEFDFGPIKEYINKKPIREAGYYMEQGDLVYLPKDLILKKESEPYSQRGLVYSGYIAEAKCFYLKPNGQIKSGGYYRRIYGKDDIDHLKKIAKEISSAEAKKVIDEIYEKRDESARKQLEKSQKDKEKTLSKFNL